VEFLDIVKARYSVRAYRDVKVEEEKLLKVLEAGRLAPSACNFQPWVFVVVREARNRKRLRAAYDKEWFVNAPVIIAVCCDRKRAWMRFDGKKYGDVDAAIAMDHIILQAAELGLGTCWIGAFNEEEARKALGLPFNLEPVALTPLGYPAAPPGAKDRVPLDSIVKWESFA
jgi:nitroreductase